MKRLLQMFFLIGFTTILFSGCENVAKNTRQTGKNLSVLFLDGYSNDLYESR